MCANVAGRQDREAYLAALLQLLEPADAADRLELEVRIDGLQEPREPRGDLQHCVVIYIGIEEHDQADARLRPGCARLRSRHLRSNREHLLHVPYHLQRNATVDLFGDIEVQREIDSDWRLDTDPLGRLT